MITIQRITVNPLQENCYIVHDETNECVIIDNGAFSANETDRIERYLTENQLKPVAQIFTHGHFDHIMGSNSLFLKYGLKAILHPYDESLYTHCDKQLWELIGMKRDVVTAPLGESIEEGDCVAFGNHKLHVIHTPGHTPGGVCFYCREENVLFSGDSLFKQSIGRTDFQGGDYDALIRGIQDKLLTLPEETKVYPGHGPATSVAEELSMNPYLRMV